MKKFIIFTSLIVLIGIFFGYSYYKRILNSSPGTSQKEHIFVVEKGAGVPTVAAGLFKENLIKSEDIFKYYLKNSGKDKDLKAGKYALNQSMTMLEVVEALTHGNVLNEEKTIKIIEGWTNKEIAEYFDSQGLSGERFLEIVKETKEKASQYPFLLGIRKGYDLEGFLFPDTYRIYANASEDEIVNKMLANFDLKLTDEMKSEIKKQGKSIYEIVTMASIIQKEVRSIHDMKLVSGVFWNRINNFKPLESCASLAYILGVNKKQYSLEDTQVDSPYNTYQNAGLPPGPIANPGFDAIYAAIYPTDSDYFYFLSRFDNGETVFSKTYDEHLRNKAKHLK